MVTLQADTWEAMADMLDAGPRAVSSILLAAPAWDGDFARWSGPVFAALEAGIVAAQAADRLGVVCFHPAYATPDGKSWPGFGHMHSVPRLQRWLEQVREQKLKQKKKSGDDTSGPVLTADEVAAGGAWQRRTPHATINVLRADQLAAAEGRRSTPTLYSDNIHKLIDEIGSPALQEMLDEERRIGC
jgi:hypothetical protein